MPRASPSGRDGTRFRNQPDSTAPVQVGIAATGHIYQSGRTCRAWAKIFMWKQLPAGRPNINIPGTDGAGLLNQGYVETSNVNVVEELVNMIQTQRAYEINSKAMQTSDQMLQRLSQM